MAICNIFTRTITFVGDSVKVEKDVQCPLHASNLEWQIYFTPLKINRTTLVLSPFPALFNRFQDACSFVRPFVRPIKFIHIVHRELDREYMLSRICIYFTRLDSRADKFVLRTWRIFHENQRDFDVPSACIFMRNSG